MEKSKIGGYISAFGAYLLWGVLPIYWKQLGHLSATGLLGIRMIMTCITLLIVVHILKKPLYMSYIKTPKTRYRLMISSFFITVNWGIFIYAVNAGHMLDASLGYYINPLISVFLGIFILKEKLTKSQYISIALAFVGVIYLTLSYGKFPWIAMCLAFSFAFYGLLKKVYHLDSFNSLLVEVLYILPFMIYFTMSSKTDVLFSGNVDYAFIFIIFAGVVTVIPLILFSEAAKRIPLSAIGFLQYIAPTLMLLIGVLIYGETFSIDHAISFGFIWLGLSIYTVTVIKNRNNVASEDVC